MGGGNSHQRAMEKAKQKKIFQDTVGLETENMGPNPTIEPGNRSQINPLLEWNQPLNRADSIGIFGILMGTLFILIVPAVWHKVPL